MGLRRKRRLDREKRAIELKNWEAEREAARIREEQTRALAAQQQLEYEIKQRALRQEKQMVARWNLLCSKFREAVAKRVWAGNIWIGQPEQTLVASLGEPASKKQRVLKTKTRELWSYWPNDRGHFRLKLTIENGEVVGWETLEGTTAPVTDPP